MRRVSHGISDQMCIQCLPGTSSSDGAQSGTPGSSREPSEDRSGEFSREPSPSEPPEDPEVAAQRRLQDDVTLMQATKIRAQRAVKVHMNPVLVYT